MEYTDNSWGEFEMRPTLITHYRDDKKLYLYTVVLFNKFEKVTRHYASGKRYTLWRKLRTQSQTNNLNIFECSITELPLLEGEAELLRVSMLNDYQEHKDCEHNSIQVLKLREGVNVKVEYIRGKRVTPIGKSNPLF